MSTEWMHAAACRDDDPERWLIDDSEPAEEWSAVLPLKAVCAGCPVRLQCLDYALSFETCDANRWGIWGGLTPRQRSSLAKEAS
jgi:WhiB family redox-sensing transcriptional regulator